MFVQNLVPVENKQEKQCVYFVQNSIPVGYLPTVEVCSIDDGGGEGGFSLICMVPIRYQPIDGTNQHTGTCHGPFRRLALSMLFTIVTASYQTTCTTLPKILK